MTCGGEVEVLFEHFTQKAWEIAIFGAGHVVPYVKFSQPSNAQLHALTLRADWLALIDYPNVKTVCLDTPGRVYCKNRGT